MVWTKRPSWIGRGCLSFLGPRGLGELAEGIFRFLDQEAWVDSIQMT